MKVKAVLPVLLLVLSMTVYSKDMAGLYQGASSALKNGGAAGENFLGSELASTNFMKALEKLYFESSYANSQEYASASSASHDELNDKIVRELRSVDFDKTIASVKPDTKVTPLPRNLCGGKLAGIRTRKWFYSSRKAEEEVKARRSVLREIKKDFQNFEREFRKLNRDLKNKFYVYISQAVKGIKNGNYKSAKSTTDYINRYIIKK